MKVTTDTTIATTCAPPAEVTWHQINWPKVHSTVRRLQTRIAKATKEGRWGKVKALQHLLTHSFSGKALSVKRVTENQGKRTPGVDKETWSTPDTKSEAIVSLRQRGYKPLPLRRVHIPKAKPDHSRFNITGSGGTRLGHALWWAWGELCLRRETRKICIAFSDGDTGDGPVTQAAIKRMRESGIEVIGIGIQDNSIKQYLPDNHRIINNLDQFTPALLELLREKLVA